MLSFIKGLLGDSEGKKHLDEARAVADTVNQWEAEISALSDEELAAKTVAFKARLKEGATLDDILPEAFAVVREVAKRLLAERHYDVQIMGGYILHKGMIAEMRTGEGKTLVATLPTYLNALSGRGVHLVTVNDYLSRRDAVWMGQIYAFLGLSVGIINSNTSYLYDATPKEQSEEDTERDTLGVFKVEYEFLQPVGRQEAYAADITYGTNSEFGFDYLRDNIEYDAKNLRQRDPYYAIVDEIDSILIDEARTPLIISAPAQESGDLYDTFAKIAETLVEGEDYEVDEKHRSIGMKDSGIEKAESALGVENIYSDMGIKYVHHLETAVRARAVFKRDKQYVVRDGQVVIVDEFTGRMQPGRRWSEGLHQAVEAKEGVSVQRESRTFASITYQNYFKMYEKLAGMTGTAMTSSEEFYSVYKLDVVAVPTHRPVQRIDNIDFIFRNERGKFTAIARKVKEVHEKGQPILIGTASIEKNEQLSSFLHKEGVAHEVLNAKNHEQEGEIIAQAGRQGRVTIATNMAGRGVDIKLGGIPATHEEADAVRVLGGLYVLGTERHEARRIDNQLRGRSGRQGDPGETQFFVSLEDSLMRVFATGMMGGVMDKMDWPEDQPLQLKTVTRSLESAQTKIEGFHFDARKRVLSYDNVLNTQRKSVYAKRRELLLGDRVAVEAYLDQCFALSPDIPQEPVLEKKEELGEEVFYESVRRIALQTIDLFWMEHLETMDYVRSSVNLRAYGQRDPLVEYRKEALRLYQDLGYAISERVLETIPSLTATPAEPVLPQNLRESHADESLLGKTTSGSTTSGNTAPTQQQPAVAGEKIGRNDTVTIEKNGETQQLKYKKAERLIQQEGWILVPKK